MERPEIDHLRGPKAITAEIAVFGAMAVSALTFGSGVYLSGVL
jgi:hypothetical protein